MAFRNIIIESPAHISVKNRQLVIRTDAERSLPIEDISAILLESNQSTITTGAVAKRINLLQLLFLCVVQKNSEKDMLL